MPRSGSQSSIEPPTAPASAARVTASAASSGAGPYPFSMSTETGRSVAPRERRGVLHHLVERDVAVEAPEREREPGARGRQRLEAERRQHLRGAGVPRVRDDERLAFVQCAELLGLALLGLLGHGRLRSSLDPWILLKRQAGRFVRPGLRPARAGSISANVLYALFYETPRAAPRGRRIHDCPPRMLQAVQRRGKLRMIGTFGDPQTEGAMGIFTTREAAEAFAGEDPFVANGVVGNWYIREWDEVFSRDAAAV